MFKNLLVPLDGSKLAEAVLPAARSLGSKLGARVTLLHVVEPGVSPTIHGESHLVDAPTAEEYLRSKAEEFRAAGVDVQWHVDVVERGNVSKTIFAHTAELAADLVMLTTHGQNGLREMVFGSIAQQVLSSGSVPVFMLRPEMAGPDFEPRRILVPLDSSDVHEPSLYLAIDLAGYYGAALHLVVVVPTLSTLSPERAATGVLLPSSTRAILDLAENGAAEYLQARLNEIKSKGIGVTAEVERGATAARLLEVANRQNVDLVVMATHAHSGLGAFWQGSVTPQVMAQVKAPVLLMRVFGKETPR